MACHQAQLGGVVLARRAIWPGPPLEKVFIGVSQWS